MSLRAPKRSVKLALLVAVAAPLAACASTTGATSDHDREVHFELRNDRIEDVRVYVAQGSNDLRLATVGGFENRTVSIPWTRLEGAGNVHLVATPLGGGQTLRSNPVFVGEGDTVVWEIGARPALSYLTVRSCC